MIPVSSGYLRLHSMPSEKMIKGRNIMPDEKMVNQSKVKEAAACLKTLAHEFRLSVMCSLVDGEKNVQQLMRVTGASQSNLSQHLAKMRDKGLLESRREANQIFYRISDRKMLEILKALHSIFCTEGEDA